jgi:hypothetical protein
MILPLYSSLAIILQKEDLPWPILPTTIRAYFSRTGGGGEAANAKIHQILIPLLQTKAKQ